VRRSDIALLVKHAYLKVVKGEVLCVLGTMNLISVENMTAERGSTHLLHPLPNRVEAECLQAYINSVPVNSSRMHFRMLQYPHPRDAAESPKTRKSAPFTCRHASRTEQNTEKRGSEALGCAEKAGVG
jgi:hypothetical protein